MRHTAVLALLFAVALVATSTGQIPNVLSYQGVLKSADGAVVPDGAYELTFRLYISETSGAALWTEVQTVAVVDGIFDVLLGSVVAFDASFHDAYWLGIGVEGQPELSPRMPLSTAPYARTAGGVVDGSISTDALGEDAVTSEKIAPDAIVSEAISAGAVETSALADESVTSAKIADWTIELADIGQNGALQAQVIKWNGQAWVADDDYGAQGAISGVFGIDGLTGGGTSGVVQIGIAEGGVQSDMIAPNSITTAQIASGAVEPYQIANGSATDGMVLKWSAGQQSWMPDTDAEGIQSVVAGNVLTGGGQGGEVDLNVDFGGVGSSPTVSHSDHHHDDSYINTGEEDAITPGMVADNVIGSAELASLAVSTAKLGTGAVTEGKIALSAVTESRIASSAVTGNKLATAAVDSSKLGHAAVSGPKLAPAAVATDKLEDAAVTGPKLGTAAVATDKLEDAAVTGPKLGTAAVATDKLEDAAVTGAKLGTAAVATDKLEDAAVTGPKLGAAAVSTDKLEDSAVTGAKIADHSIEFLDLAQGGATQGEVMKWSDARGGWEAAPDSVGIVDVTAGDGLEEVGIGGPGTVTLSVDFAGSGTATTVPRSDHDHDAIYVEAGEANSVSSAMIIDGAVGSDDIASSAVTSAKIADGTIGFVDISPNGATDGQVMKWSGTGSAWVAADDVGGGGGGGWADDGAIVRLDDVSDYVGIGTATPAAKLDVVGDLRANGLTMPTGAADGLVLTSDSFGAASWQVSPGGMGGGGTDEFVPVFTSAATLGDSDIHQSAGDQIGIGVAAGGSKVTIEDDGVLPVLRVRHHTVPGDPDHVMSLERVPSSGFSGGMLQITMPGGTTGNHFVECVNSPPGAPVFSVNGFGDVSGRAAEFITDELPSNGHVVHAEFTGYGGGLDVPAVYGKSTVAGGNGVGGEFVGSGVGVEGRVDDAQSGGSFGVKGIVHGSNTTTKYGVYGAADGTSGTNYGVYGVASGSMPSCAGYFVGDVGVTDNLEVWGDLSVHGDIMERKGAALKIDHPLDPANRTLSHSFVESPDMMNVYNGNAVLDADGTAVVELPDWFEALNRDFRYQLTCIGGFAPVYIAKEVAGNRFRIAGGTPGLKVSWQLTGIRHGRFADEHRTPVEEEKPGDERGTYLHPELYGRED